MKEPSIGLTSILTTGPVSVSRLLRGDARGGESPGSGWKGIQWSSSETARPTSQESWRRGREQLQWKKPTSVWRADYRRREDQGWVERVPTMGLVSNGWGGRRPEVQSMYGRLSLSKGLGCVGKHTEPQMFLKVCFNILDWMIHTQTQTPKATHRTFFTSMSPSVGVNTLEAKVEGGVYLGRGERTLQ